MEHPLVLRSPWSYPGHVSSGRQHVYDHHPPIGLRWLGARDPSASWRDVTSVPAVLWPILAAGPREAYAIATPADDRADEHLARCAAALAIARSGDRPQARTLLRRRPATLTSEYTLGLVELLWSPSRALRCFEQVVARVETSVRPGFAGMLPWSEPSNRPFLLALRGLAFTAGRRGGPFGCEWPLDSLRWLDPSDPLGTAEWSRLLAGGTWPEDDDFPDPR